MRLEKDSLIRTAYRFFIIGKIFGVSCFSIKKSKSNSKYTEATRCDLSLLFGFLAIQMVLTYENIVNPQRISSDRIFNTTAQFIIGGAPIVCIAAVLKAFFDREKLWTTIFAIRSIDDRLKKLGIVINHSLYYRYVSIYLFVCYPSFLIYMAMFISYLAITMKASSVFYIMSCLFVNGMMTVTTNQFHLILAVLHTRFTLLNNFILKTFNLTDEVTQEMLLDSTSLLVTLAEVTRSHELLNTTANKANYLYSFHILGAIQVTFCITLFPIYETYGHFVSDDAFTLPFLLVCLITSAVFHNLMLLVLVILTHLTKTSSDYTAVVVHKAIAKESRKPVILQLKLLSQQILHQSPTFGCYLFSYNWPFVFTYIAAMASYLVILMQFKTAFDIPKRNHESRSISL